MTLFTKKGCKKCSYIKRQIPADLRVKIYDVQTREGLAELAYLELVPTAEKILPILVHGGRVITGAINIKREIHRHVLSSSAPLPERKGKTLDPIC